MPEKNEYGLCPCHWCGNKAVHPVATERPIRGMPKMYYIHCGVYSCNRPYATFHETEQEAIDAWNIEAEMEAAKKAGFDVNHF